MSFVLFTDSSSNITPDLAAQWDVRIVSLYYTLDGGEHPAYDPDFDGRRFYDALRNRAEVRTSMINADQLAKAFEPALAAGEDLIYIGMSSGISGTVQAAAVAAGTLQERYPERRIYVKDTLGASFGEGLFVKKVSEMRAAGKDIDEAAAWVDENVQRMNQVFTVEDLMFLRRGGRLSGMSAVIGTLANVKPILWGNEEGKIVSIDKMIGRKRSLRALADRYANQVIDPEGQTIAIAHSDCEADAQYLIDLIRRQFPKQEVLVRCYEPGTGAHVGPGAVALFFFGKTR